MPRCTVTNRGDARASLVRITAKGRRQLKTTGRMLQQRLEAELSEVPEQRLQALAGSLGGLSSALLAKVHSGRV